MGGPTKDKLTYDPAYDSETDSVAAFVKSSDGTLITHTTDGSKERLDVDVKLADGNADSFGLYDEDSAHSSGDKGQQILAVRNDTKGTLVDADGDYAPLQVNADGELRVAADISVETGSDKEEDTAHQDGDIGTYILGVRQDTLASSVSADGDYGSIKFDALGRLWTRATIEGDVADDDADSGNPIKVGTRAVFGAALAAISDDDDRADMISDEYRRLHVNGAYNVNLVSSQKDISQTAAEKLVATNMPGREAMMIQNLGNRKIYVGASGVSASTGIRLSGRGGTLELKLGPALDLYAIGTDATAEDVRILEMG
jgi:hypothetical protein